MDTKEYLTFLDDLTHEERSIFFYCYVFNLPLKDTSFRLKMDIKKVRRIIKMLQDQKELLFIKDDLLEQFGI